MSKIAELANMPEVSFIGYTTLEEVKSMVSQWYNEKYTELTGTAPALSDAAPEKLLQYAIAMMGGQLMQYIQDKGNGELLATSYGGYLDQLAANLGVVRKAAERATVTMRFTLADTRSNAVGMSPPARVAWIETRICRCGSPPHCASPPARVAWIETYLPRHAAFKLLCRHPRGWRG